MSDFTQIMLGAVLAAIFGVWGNIIAKVWQKGSGKTKAVIVTVTVIAFFAVMGFAGYNGWISLPKVEPVAQQWKIVKGVIILILSFVAIFGLWLLLFYLLCKIFNNIGKHFLAIVGIFCLILFIIIPFIEYFILHMDMNFAGILSLVIAPLFGINVLIAVDDLVPVNMSDAGQSIIIISIIILILTALGYLYILMAYETFAFLTTRQFAPPLGAFIWIGDTAVFLFG